ncbi:MAG: EAL domain-containing protein, partial [Chloroflexota bacterium]
VLYLDLDRFKYVNDQFGHLNGDDLLIKISRGFNKSMREVDTISRFGGDEFLLLLEGDIKLEEAKEFADRLQELLGKSHDIGGNFVTSTASIGIVMSDNAYKIPDEYIRDADVAMYHAKSNGRGRYEIFTNVLQDVEFQRLNIESDLRRAIKDNEFIINYQPIVSLTNNKITGFEALIRWKSRKSGNIYPNEFIPLAEESGLIVDLGFWVLFEACKQVHEWQKKYNQSPALSVNVNISIKQLIHPDFVGELKQILSFLKMTPSNLVLEVKETIFLKHSNAISETLTALDKLGVRICLDDFGFSTSTSKELKKLTVDRIKIDRSFVNTDLKEKSASDTILNIVERAGSAKIEIIAKGIESLEQAILLKNMGCQFGQGFLFNEAQNSIAMEKYIDQYFKIVN